MLQSVVLTINSYYLSNRLKPTIDMTIPLSRELRGIFIFKYGVMSLPEFVIATAAQSTTGISH